MEVVLVVIVTAAHAVFAVVIQPAEILGAS
jgi:hypothetical protein